MIHSILSQSSPSDDLVKMLKDKKHEFIYSMYCKNIHQFQFKNLSSVCKYNKLVQAILISVILMNHLNVIKV